MNKNTEIKPLEMIFEEDEEDENCFQQIIFYNDGSKEIVYLHELPKYFVLGRHYNITDLYGNSVIDDRKGL